MLCDLTEMGLIKIQGIESKKFLQGQLTCDMESITPSHGCMGAHCNPQGRIISLFYLFMLQESYYLLMQQNMIPIAITALKKYAVFFKIELRDASEDMLAIGCQNPMPDDALNNPTCIRISISSSRYIIAGTSESIQNIRDEKLKNMSMISNDQWKYLDIQDGIPTLYPITSGKFLPHDIGLDRLNAISFEKGCYTGQEIIARMHYRGKLKNHMYKACISTHFSPQAGASIYAQHGDETKVCGMVVDACLAANNQYHVLIMTDELHAKHSSLFLHDEKQAIFTVFDQQSG